jgi:protein-disulfide isomerase
MFLRCTFTVPSVRPICSRTMPVGETFRDETEHLEALHAGAAQADGSGDRIEEAAVELVEFGDYECPHCRKAHPIVKRLKQRFDHRLDFRFRNSPLSQIHPYVQHAAEAAVSVRSQAGEEAFWAMHDAVFTHQRESPDALDDEHLARYAEETGADAARVRSDLDSAKFEETVEADFRRRSAHRGGCHTNVLHQWRTIRR